MTETLNEAREIAAYAVLVLFLSVLCAAAGAGLAFLIATLTK